MSAIAPPQSWKEGEPLLFVMAGGGTGGHVVPAIAVARQLRSMGHDVLFIGTQRGMESSIVPREGFAIEWIEIGGLQRVGFSQTLKSLAQLPVSIWKSRRLLKRRGASAIFSTGGYVAAPVMIAAVLSGVPMTVMEPNALPGLVSRKLANHVQRAFLSFEETRKYFPADRSELTGLPVRNEFFSIPERAPGALFQILITGGSRGSAALNKAAQQSWPFFRNASSPVHMVLQCGAAQHEMLAQEFAATGLSGEVVPFIHDMPATYAAADLVISRSGAGAISELSAAGKPSLLIPFPYSADDHQRHNAEAMRRAGAAELLLESQLSGSALFEMVERLRQSPDLLLGMSRAARGRARPGAAERAAEVLIELARR